MREVKATLIEKARSFQERKVRAVAYAGEAYVLHFLGLLFALAILAYLYFVGVSIMNVISHREASLESDRLRSQVASLEAEYFALESALSSASATNFELISVTDTAFTRRNGAVATNRTVDSF